VCQKIKNFLKKILKKLRKKEPNVKSTVVSLGTCDPLTSGIQENNKNLETGKCLKMKCSMCKKDACYLLYHYANDKRIEFVEGRCDTHFIINKKKVRKNRNRIKKLREGKT